MSAAGAPLLAIEDLRVTFPTPSGPLVAVAGLSLDIHRGERVGIAGESGAGKSVTALSILGLVPQPPATITGRITFDGDDLTELSRGALRHVRGARIGMVFQDPMTCLNPRLTVGAQLVESIRAHGGIRRREARARAVDLLAQVGIPAPRLRFDDHPHRLSGGMAQRVMIAMALAGEPDLIIADEPTTALDVSIEAQIIELLAGLCHQHGVAVVVITHDLAVLARFADRVVVMYGGRVVESGPIEVVYAAPSHPYTCALLASITRPDEAVRERLPAIAGRPPSPVALPAGCAFHPRCPYVVDRCLTTRPALEHRDGGVLSACHRRDELALRPGAPP